MVVVLHACRREIAVLPDAIRGDLADAVARLEAGLVLSMPFSRPMPTIGRGAHELRLTLVHAFKKTTRATSLGSVRTARRRLREISR